MTTQQAEFCKLIAAIYARAGRERQVEPQPAVERRTAATVTVSSRPQPEPEMITPA